VQPEFREAYIFVMSLFTRMVHRNSAVIRATLVDRETACLFHPAMHLSAKIFLIALVSSVVSVSQAELVWEKTEIELHPAVTDETAVAHFKYQNKGDKPIAIKSVNTSCGCTAATAKQSADPGEKGEVTATFKIGDRTGLQQKAITVTTDDPARPSTTLNLKVLIPQLLELQPTFVFWQSGEAPKTKTIVAKPGKDVSVKTLDVESSDPKFVVKVEKASANEFRINVDPPPTAQGATSTMTIRPVLEKGPAKVFYATARVVAPATGVTQQSSAAVPAATIAPVKGKIDACALLNSTEINSVQGEPLQETKPSANTVSGFAVSQCYFALPTSSNSISLTVMQKGDGPDARDPKQSWKEIFHHEGGAPKGEEEGEEKSRAPEKINGVGEEAFWAGSRVGGELYVLKGNSYFRISVGGAGDQASKIKKSKALAAKVLKRL
jgi:hypothetical protein